MAIPSGLDPRTIKKVRESFIKLLKSNPHFKAFIDTKVKGLRGKERQRAWWKAIATMIKQNSLFREAARKTLKQSGVS